MFNGGSETQHNAEQNMSVLREAYVRIIEQPAQKSLRFRYKCEGRSAGSIPGVSSTTEYKTYPSIQVVGYQGRAIVVVSCVTKDRPYRPHPHNLVGREGCKHGVCSLEIPQDRMMIQFSNLGIQCVKKRDIEEVLKVREGVRVDPFRTGFNHKNQPSSIDLNCIRLCFQVFLEGRKKGQFTIPLRPVVSEPIYDKKTTSDLSIIKLSDCVSFVDCNGKDIILLCEKVTKEDIRIRFFEEKNGAVVWEGFGDFQPFQVHKQVAISFRPPKYHNLDIQDPVKVFVQLKRPSDGATSEPLLFEFLPSGDRRRKRHKFDGLSSSERQWGQNNKTYTWNIQEGVDVRELPSTSTNSGTNNWNIPNVRPNGTQRSRNPDDVDSTNLRSFLDFTSQNAELKPINLNSGEFERVLDIGTLSESFNANLSLTDMKTDQNMTDSFTKLMNM